MTDYLDQWNTNLNTIKCMNMILKIQINVTLKQTDYKIKLELRNEKYTYKSSLLSIYAYLPRYILILIYLW